MSKKADNVVVITEDLTINNVDEIRENLLKYLKKSKKLEIVLSSLSRVDISGLQLLISLVNESCLTEKEIQFCGNFNDSFIFDINKVAFPPNTLINGEELQSFIKGVV